MPDDIPVTTGIDYDSPDWHRGYDDGFNGRAHLQPATPDYHDGWLTGDAERGMPGLDDPVWKGETTGAGGSGPARTWTGGGGGRGGSSGG